MQNATGILYIHLSTCSRHLRDPLRVYFIPTFSLPHYKSSSLMKMDSVFTILFPTPPIHHPFPRRYVPLSLHAVATRHLVDPSLCVSPVTLPSLWSIPGHRPCLCIPLIPDRLLPRHRHTQSTSSFLLRFSVKVYYLNYSLPLCLISYPRFVSIVVVKLGLSDRPPDGE